MPSFPRTKRWSGGSRFHSMSNSNSAHPSLACSSAVGQNFRKDCSERHFVLWTNNILSSFCPNLMPINVYRILLQSTRLMPRTTTLERVLDQLADAVCECEKNVDRAKLSENEDYIDS